MVERTNTIRSVCHLAVLRSKREGGGKICDEMKYLIGKFNCYE